MPRHLLRQVRLIDPIASLDRVTDVLLADGVIAEIADSIDAQADEVIDRPGLVLGTGLIDLYSHSGEPGFESRETIDSLMQAAKAGGFTQVAILPDTHPAVDNPANVDRVRQLAQGDEVQLHVWGAFTQDAAGNALSELVELAAAGVVGFADGQPIANSALLRRLLEYTQPIDRPIALYCCDPKLAGNGVMREGANSIRLGLPGNPAMSETSAIAALLEIVAEIHYRTGSTVRPAKLIRDGSPVHLMRLSTARSVDLIRTAKAQGLPITASTTWMHLLLDTNDLISYAPSLHLDPPLGNPIDRQALIAGLQDDTIDAIAIDHSPFTYEEKTVAFAEAPAGAIGLELALPLLWRCLVKSGQWTAIDLWRKLSVDPARCLGLSLNAIEPGKPANCILFDPEQIWRVDEQTLKSRSSNTPWYGQEIQGRVVRVWR
ncbi:dihydroorotase [Microcoleus sp. FACHB-1515]|uniref:dihydroorotase n=1 Tax=Cyanophyceae TaxID=3028117 RepID=UPI001688305F|nr:dihydroorotase [Microcoleus sp. FACHB-1515]MBD2089531.1 dihydroorotase [Microcoleus sp. FACHB-1515]